MREVAERFCEAARIVRRGGISAVLRVVRTEEKTARATEPRAARAVPRTPEARPRSEGETVKGTAMMPITSTTPTARPPMIVKIMPIVLVCSLHAAIAPINAHMNRAATRICQYVAPSRTVKPPMT